jgi:hypothetical protein
MAAVTIRTVKAVDHLAKTKDISTATPQARAPPVE